MSVLGAVLNATMLLESLFTKNVYTFTLYPKSGVREYSAT